MAKNTFKITTPDEDEKFFQFILKMICEPTRYSKNEDYGASWKKMRPIGITDVIGVKIDRIKSFENNGRLNHEKVDDSIRDIINYCFFRFHQYFSEAGYPLDKMKKFDPDWDLSKYE